jgi:formamidopyrimidine-DNA glycosylase
MPEGLEAEIWCCAAQVVVDRTITQVWFDQRVGPCDLADALTARKVQGVRRRGKIVLVETDGPTLGLHFGMTGRLVVDGVAPIERLEYASGADRVDWDRLRLFTEPGSVAALRMNDPRRLGRLTIDPDLDHLGPDALSASTEIVAHALRGRRIAVKSVLMDQRAIAGLGNLCADEVLYHAGVAPHRPACDLIPRECEAIAVACRDELQTMLDAGGSTFGVLSPTVRRQLPPCPLDGGALRRASIGGRTAVWCERHQA